MPGKVDRQKTIAIAKVIELPIEQAAVLRRCMQQRDPFGAVCAVSDDVIVWRLHILEVLQKALVVVSFSQERAA
jgi:hypothetical protein